MSLDPSNDLAHRLRISASLHLFNIFGANISHNALLDLEWEGVLEGLEKIGGLDLVVRGVGGRGAEDIVDLDV